MTPVRWRKPVARQEGKSQSRAEPPLRARRHAGTCLRQWVPGPPAPALRPSSDRGLPRARSAQAEWPHPFCCSPSRCTWPSRPRRAFARGVAEERRQVPLRGREAAVPAGAAATSPAGGADAAPASADMLLSGEAEETLLGAPGSCGAGGLRAAGRSATLRW